MHVHNIQYILIWERDLGDKTTHTDQKIQTTYPLHPPINRVTLLASKDNGVSNKSSGSENV